MNFFDELKRRNVFKVSIAYAIVGWLLIQVGVALFPTFGAPSWVLKVYSAAILLGFPIALLLAWAFEITPDGVKKTKDIKSSQSIGTSTGRKIDFVIIAVLVLALGFLFYDRDVPTDNATIEVAEQQMDASIAVLAFADLSQEGDQEYFGDGISESILNVLAKIDELSVSSRTSSFVFKNGDRNVTDIANILNVAHILEGSVKRAGNRVLITAQLIYADDNRHLWSDTYERELTTENIFAIQAEIANAIVAALSEELGIGIEADVNTDPLTANMDAYELFLQAQAEQTVHTLASKIRHKELLERVLELDPNFAEAWGWYAWRLAAQPGWVRSLDVQTYQYRAIEAAERALEIQPTTSAAYNALIVAYHNLHEWEQRDAAFRAAKGAIPNFQLLPWLKTDLGYLKAGNDIAAAAALRDPEYPYYPLNQGFYFEAMGETEAAMDKFEEAVLKGYGGPLQDNLVELNWALGNTGAWISFYAREFEDKDPELLPLLQSLYELKLGLQNSDPGAITRFKLIANEMGFELDALLTIGPRYNMRISDELGVALGGDEILAEYYWTNYPKMWMWRPSLHDFRQTDAFRSRVRSSGMLAYWQNHGWPDLCRADGDDDFICD